MNCSHCRTFACTQDRAVPLYTAQRKTQHTIQEMQTQEKEMVHVLPLCAEPVFMPFAVTLTLGTAPIVVGLEKVLDLPSFVPK